jgi:hypothetical protein
VDDDDAASAVAVRVRVLLGGAAVRGPARVADAVGPVERLEPDGLFEVAQLALGAADVEASALVNDRYPGRVVAAVFELPQPVEDDGHDLLVSDVADNAAHVLSLFRLSLVN